MSATCNLLPVLAERQIPIEGRATYPTSNPLASRLALPTSFSGAAVVAIRAEESPEGALAALSPFLQSLAARPMTGIMTGIMTGTSAAMEVGKAEGPRGTIPRAARGSRRGQAVAGHPLFRHGEERRAGP